MDFLQQYGFQLLSAAVLVVVWCIRLEGKVNAVQRDLERNYGTKAEAATLAGEQISQSRAIATLIQTTERIEHKLDRLLLDGQHRD